jgi:ABC-type transport system substrate-binding protein
MFQRTRFIAILTLFAVIMAACGGPAQVSTPPATQPSAAADVAATPTSPPAEAGPTETPAEAAPTETPAEAAPTEAATTAAPEPAATSAPTGGTESVLITPAPLPAPTPGDLAEDQTIRYVTRGFSRLDPAAEGGFGRFVISHLWMPLFLRNTENQLMPWLATGYEVNDDATVYTVHIDPRAVWSDGTPVLAQEAKDYWTYGLNPETCEGCYLSVFAGFEVISGAKDLIDGTSKDLTGVVVKDDKTIEFNLTGPDPIFLQRLALFDAGFAKMEDVKKGPEFAADGSARVNGPFMVKTWNVNEKQYEIVQNPKWWGDKKPTITRIVAQESADENISFVQWQNDEADIVHWLSNIREQVRPNEPDAFHLIPYATNIYFPLWVKLPPMDDLNVRRALVHAVDWDAAIAAAWEGARNDRVMKTILTPELSCYKAGNWPDWGFDPAKAKEELAKSKYGSPDKLGKIRITTGGQSPNYIRMAEIIAEQWKNNLGITDIEIKPGTMDAWGQDAESVQVLRQSQGALLPDPVNLLASHYNTAIDPKNNGMVDEELGTMLDTLKVMSRDDPDFCAKVQEAEAKLLGHYYLLPMIWDLYEYTTKPWVKNFATNVDNNWYTLLDMYIAKH